MPLPKGKSSMTRQKFRIGLVYGGRSGEHEVSLVSAKAVMENLDRDKYEVVPIGITRNGIWLLGTEPAQLMTAGRDVDQGDNTNTTAVTLPGDPTIHRLIPLRGDTQLQGDGKLDVIFPILHGTYGEDGTLQGLLEMANVPYVGCNVLGAALGMDKEKTKIVLSSVGLPVGKYLVYRRNQWEHDPEIILKIIEQQLGYPNFVKPVNM